MPNPTGRVGTVVTPTHNSAKPLGKPQEGLLDGRTVTLEDVDKQIPAPPSVSKNADGKRLHQRKITAPQQIGFLKQLLYRLIGRITPLQAADVANFIAGATEQHGDSDLVSGRQFSINTNSPAYRRSLQLQCTRLAKVEILNNGAARVTLLRPYDLNSQLEAANALGRLTISPGAGGLVDWEETVRNSDSEALDALERSELMKAGPLRSYVLKDATSSDVPLPVFPKIVTPHHLSELRKIDAVKAASQPPAPELENGWDDIDRLLVAENLGNTDTTLSHLQSVDTKYGYASPVCLKDRAFRFLAEKRAETLTKSLTRTPHPMDKAYRKYLGQRLDKLAIEALLKQKIQNSDLSEDQQKMVLDRRDGRVDNGLITVLQQCRSKKLRLMQQGSNIRNQREQLKLKREEEGVEFRLKDLKEQVKAINGQIAQQDSLIQDIEDMQRAFHEVIHLQELLTQSGNSSATLLELSTQDAYNRYERDGETFKVPRQAWLSMLSSSSSA